MKSNLPKLELSQEDGDFIDQELESGKTERMGKDIPMTGVLDRAAIYLQEDFGDRFAFENSRQFFRDFMLVYSICHLGKTFVSILFDVLYMSFLKKYNEIIIEQGRIKANHGTIEQNSLSIVAPSLIFGLWPYKIMGGMLYHGPTEDYREGLKEINFYWYSVDFQHFLSDYYLDTLFGLAAKPIITEGRDEQGPIYTYSMEDITEVKRFTLNYNVVYLTDDFPINDFYRFHDSENLMNILIVEGTSPATYLVRALEADPKLMVIFVRGLQSAFFTFLKDTRSLQWPARGVPFELTQEAARRAFRYDRQPESLFLAELYSPEYARETYPEAIAGKGPFGDFLRMVFKYLNKVCVEERGFDRSDFKSVVTQSVIDNMPHMTIQKYREEADQMLLRPTFLLRGVPPIGLIYYLFKINLFDLTSCPYPTVKFDGLESIKGFPKSLEEAVDGIFLKEQGYEPPGNFSDVVREREELDAKGEPGIR